VFARKRFISIQFFFSSRQIMFARKRFISIKIRTLIIINL